MNVKILFKGFNFSQDGPGNRLVYHLQGCNMHCPWCSNPESIPENGSLMVKGDLEETHCIFGAIENGSIDRERCKACLEKPCVRLPSSNLQLSCADTDVEDIVDEVKRCSPMFFDGGGVTFTGGEPTLQFDALKMLLFELKRLGINTAVETNGSRRQLPELFSLIDFLIMDCKHYDSHAHEEATGLGNEIVLRNIAAAAGKRPQLLIRIPLIGGFNSSKKDALNFVKLFKKLHAENCQFELLKYHEYGKDKWDQCGKDYLMKNAEVSDKGFEEFSQVFKTNGLKLIRT
ncbi:MAG: glycyl-radical enzyme activating protein [Clostridiales bacterium]|nr:glycyl-radical enzyme activating protein [Clostridiales bacterium]